MKLDPEKHSVEHTQEILDTAYLSVYSGVQFSIKFSDAQTYQADFLNSEKGEIHSVKFPYMLDEDERKVLLRAVEESQNMAQIFMIMSWMMAKYMEGEPRDAICGVTENITSFPTTKS